MKDTWTSRKRIEAALNHQEADRVPLDLSITLNAYINLRDYLGLPVEENVQADRFFEVQPSHDLLEALGVDVTYVRLGKSRNWSPLPPLEDGTVLNA